MSLRQSGEKSIGFGSRAATPLRRETLLHLPSPAARRILFAYPDGRPATNLEVLISLDLAVLGRCGVHRGIPIGTFRTAATGTIAFRAPLSRLHADIGYYTRMETGRYCLRPEGDALEIGPEADIVHNACILTTCSVTWGTAATTDNSGVAQFQLVAQDTESLRLEKGTASRDITEEELRQLFATGRLAVTW